MLEFQPLLFCTQSCLGEEYIGVNTQFWQQMRYKYSDPAVCLLVTTAGLKTLVRFSDIHLTYLSVRLPLFFLSLGWGFFICLANGVCGVSTPSSVVLLVCLFLAAFPSEVSWLLAIEAEFLILGLLLFFLRESGNAVGALFGWVALKSSSIDLFFSGRVFKFYNAGSPFHHGLWKWPGCMNSMLEMLQDTFLVDGQLCSIFKDSHNCT